MFKAILLLISISNATDTLESLKIIDLSSLQRCYMIKPYILTEKNGEKKTEVYVDENEIQRGCGQKADALAKGLKDKIQLIAIAEEVRKNQSMEASLKIHKVIVENDRSLKACDDLNLFKALKAGLSHPKNFPNAAESYANNALSIISLCQKNSQFLADILEESENTNTYIETNLCDFFKEKNLKNKCKK